MRLSRALVLCLGMLPATWAQQSAPGQPDPLVGQLAVIEQEFVDRVRSAGFRMTSSAPTIVVDTLPQLSMYTRQDNTIHTARWEKLPPNVQDIVKRWATYAGHTTGEQLFDDMFHRFFFVHELAHWLQIQGKNDTNDVYQRELEPTRLTVAYWRESDSSYLSMLLTRFRRISERLPNPLPPGQDAEQYFKSNYRGLGSNPDVYGWFQLRMVIEAATERPVRTFSEAVHRLADHESDSPRQ